MGVEFEDTRNPVTYDAHSKISYYSKQRHAVTSAGWFDKHLRVGLAAPSALMEIISDPTQTAITSSESVLAGLKYLAAIFNPAISSLIFCSFSVQQRRQQHPTTTSSTTSKLSTMSSLQDRSKKTPPVD